MTMWIKDKQKIECNGMRETESSYYAYMIQSYVDEPIQVHSDGTNSTICLTINKVKQILNGFKLK